METVDAPADFRVQMYPEGDGVRIVVTGTRSGVRVEGCGGPWMFVLARTIGDAVRELRRVEAGASPAVREAAAFAAEEMERIAAWVDHRDAALQLREAAATLRAALAAEGEPAGPTE